MAAVDAVAARERKTHPAPPAPEAGAEPGVPVFLLRASGAAMVDAPSADASSPLADVDADDPGPLGALVRTKLIVGAPDDPAEREAEAIAAAVVSAPSPASSPPTGGGASPSSSASASTASAPAVLRRAPVDASASSGSPAVPSAAAPTVTLPGQGPGAPMSPRTRGVLEPRLGADLGGVRVHRDGPAQEAAAALGARAFAAGSDIWLGAGQSDEDVGLMAHETAHVLQGGGAIRRAPAAAGTAAPPAPKPKKEGKEKKGDKKGSEKKKKGEGKGEKEAAAPAGGGGEGGGGVTLELQMPTAPTELSRDARERLETVQESNADVAETAADLPPAEEQVGEARGAVTEPTEEAEARAQESVVAQLDEREPPSPEIEELCQKIYATIRAKRPPDEDSLVEADPQQMATEAGGQLNSDVQGDTRRVSGEYDGMGQTPPAAPGQVGEPIEAPPADVDAVPADASQAAPDPVPAEDVSLDADAAASAQQIEDAGMTGEVADEAARGDPSSPLAQARDAQGELEATAARDPAEVLAEQQAALTRASEEMAQLQGGALEVLRAARAGTVAETGGQQTAMVGTEEEMRQQASTRARGIFNKAKDDVAALLRPLPEAAMTKWEAGKGVLAEEFKQSLARVKAWIDERHSGVGGALLAGLDYLTGLPDWVTEEYDRAEQKFGDGVCALIRDISRDVNTTIAACEVIIDDARKEISELFASLPDELQEWAQGEQAGFAEQLDGLQNEATEARANLNRDLAQRASSAVQEVRTEIHALRKAAGGLLGAIVDAVNAFLDDPVKFIIEGLLKLVGIDPGAFWAVVARIQQVTADIADDPMGFANNLLAGIGQGFTQFFDNIGSHLVGGFFDWLFSGLGSVGVQIPSDFSLKGLVTFALQLMGITWDRVRRLLAKHIGEQNVALIEKAYELVSTLMEKGPEGIFEMIKEQLDPQRIIDQIIQAGIEFLVEALIKVVSARILLMLNPAGAIAQALEAIYRILKWVFENAARLFGLVEAVVNGMAAIVAGNVSGMASAVEGGLARLIAPVIDFLAGYMGLGDLPEKIADVIRGFQEWIEGILDRVIGFLAERAKGLLRSLGIGQEKPEGQPGEDEVGEVIPFSADGEGHRLWIKVDGNAATPMVASDDPKPIELRLQEWDGRLHELSAERPPEGGKSPQEKAGSLIAEARRINSDTDRTAEQVVRVHAPAAGGAPAAGAGAAADAAVVAKERSLADVLRQLFDLFGDEVGGGDLKVRFRSEIARFAPTAAADLNAGLDALIAEHVAAGGVPDYANFDAVLAELRGKGEGNAAGKVLTKPLLPHTFGNWAVGAIAVPAVELAVEDVEGQGKPVIPKAKDSPLTFVNHYKSPIHQAQGAFVESARAVSDAAANFGLRTHAEDVMLHEFTLRLTFGEDVHHLYEPKVTRKLAPKPGGGYSLEYDTHGGAHFAVDLDKDKVLEKIKGTSLKHKSKAGVAGRGYWTTAQGQVSNADLNAAHAIADEFLGSGYRASFNLIPTSARFNQKDMAAQEKAIKRQLSLLKADEFDLEVSITWTDVMTPTIVAEIQKVMPAETAAAISAKLSAFAAKVGAGFRRVESVRYQAEFFQNTPAGRVAKGSYDDAIGPDLYLGFPL